MSRVAVFIDWQNAYKTAREAFGFEVLPNEYGNFSPLKLGFYLAVSNDRGVEGTDLVKVEVHRGLPSQAKDPRGYAANRRQSAAWQNERPGIVVPRTRALRYPENYPSDPPVEKGVDVQLALSALDYALSDKADVVIIFSHDQDLLPVPELIARNIGPNHVETASWAPSGSFRQRLEPKGSIKHHFISQRVFAKIETRVNYARSTTA